MWKKVWKWVLGHEPVIFLMAFTLFLRIPTLFEPYWYGDEGIYLAIGKALSAGAVLYRDIEDNKPPLIYFVAGLVEGNQFWYRFIALWWNVATVGVFYALARTLFAKRVWVEIACTLLFALLTNIPMFEGNIANGEIFFLLPTLWGAYLLFTSHTGLGRIFWAGCLFGIAGLFKLPALVEIGIWPVYWLVFERKTWFKRSVVLALGVFAVFGLSFVYFGLHGVALEYVRGAFGQNIGYVSSWGTAAMGGIYTLKVRAVVAVGTLGVLLVLGKRLEKRTWMVAGLVSLTVFGALISGRPYPHYALQVVGAGALGVGILVLGKLREKIFIFGTFFVFGIILGLVMSGGNLRQFPTYKTMSYYENFGQWVLGRRSREAYFNHFDQAVLNTYTVATYIYNSTSADDSLFIWGERPMIYALAKRVPVGRYTASYHIKDFRAEEETLIQLRDKKPVYIVSYGKDEELPGLTLLLEKSYKAVAVFGTARIYRYNPDL